MIWQRIKSFDWGFYISALLDAGIAGFLAYALMNFVYEVWQHQRYVSILWHTLSIGEKELINVVLCLQDLNILITVGLIILFVKLRR